MGEAIKGIGSALGFGGGPDYTGQNSGYPTAPTLQNPDTIRSNLNTDPLHNLEAFANGRGDSPWAKAQLDALQTSQGQAMGAAQTNANAANAGAIDSAGSHGGLTSGMAANAANQGANRTAMAGQDVIGKGLAQQGQIRSTDAQNRITAMNNLPGMEVQSTQPDLQAASINQAGLNAANQNALTMYGNQINQQAGQEMAGAQQNRGKK